MTLEVAILNIVPAKSEEFEKNFAKAQRFLSSRKGYVSHELKKCIEKTDRYILLVKWETLEDHEIGFRNSEEYQEWKKLLHHYYSPFPTVEHYEDVTFL